MLYLSTDLFFLFILSSGNELEDDIARPVSSQNTRKKWKDPRVVSFKRSIFRKEAMNKKMKVENDAGIDTVSTAKTAAKRVVKECGENVRSSNDKV